MARRKARSPVFQLVSSVKAVLFLQLFVLLPLVMQMSDKILLHGKEGRKWFLFESRSVWGGWLLMPVVDVRCAVCTVPPLVFQRRSWVWAQHVPYIPLIQCNLIKLCLKSKENSPASKNSCSRQELSPNYGSCTNDCDGLATRSNMCISFKKDISLKRVHPKK